MDPGNWCTIESDPGVFTTMLKDFGVKGIQIEELWGLEKSAIEAIRAPLKAIIFLFKYDPEVVKKTHEKSQQSLDTSIYFAKQIINNACATQALINTLLNFDKSSDKHFELGDLLDNFKNFTVDFPSDTRGETLSNSDEIRAIHNSYSRNTVFEIDNSLMRTKKEDPFHFVAYMPYKGKLIELDGLMPAPIDHGELEDKANPENWIQTAQKVLQKRMQLYGGEIRFNLMAIVGDKKLIAEEKLALETEKENFNAELVCELQNEIEAEELKFEKYTRENILMRHNFLPMIIEHMKILAEEGKLVERISENRVKAPAAAAGKV